MSQTLSPSCTNIWTPPHDQVCIFIPLHQHIPMSGFLPFFSLNCILSYRDPNLFEHVHFEWTYSLVPLRVYCSSGVGLRLTLAREKSLLDRGSPLVCVVPDKMRGNVGARVTNTLSQSVWSAVDCRRPTVASGLKPLAAALYSIKDDLTGRLDL